MKKDFSISFVDRKEKDGGRPHDFLSFVFIQLYVVFFFNFFNFLTLKTTCVYSTTSTPPPSPPQSPVNQIPLRSPCIHSPL
jgi:hypothetical protein